MKQSNYILWLPSWYPNKFEPSNGDFIQRHAQATSIYIPVTVYHFPQSGETIFLPEDTMEVKQNHNLKEIIHYFSYQPAGNNFFNKLKYNILYYKKAKRSLEAYFIKYGLPKLVHVHVPMKAGNLAIWIKEKYGIDYLVSEQSSAYMKSSPDYFLKKNFLHRHQVKKIFRVAQTVTNVSATIGKVLSNAFKLKAVHPIHNTVDTRLFNYTNQKPEVFTFIHVSALGEQKNISGILKAIYSLKKIRADWVLKIIGPYNSGIKEQIDNLSLNEKVHLSGELSYEEVAQSMKDAHVMVLFSKHENFPCVVVEALCTGLPVISSDVAGVKEAVNETNGILVASEDEMQLTKALERIRSTYSSYNPESIARKAAELYSFKTIGKEFFNLYKQQH